MLADDPRVGIDGAAWRPLGSDGAGNGPLNSAVNALAIYQHAVVAGGNFTNAGGDATGATAGQLFEKHGLVEHAGVRTAISLWIFETQQVEPTTSTEQLSWKLLGLLPLVDMGADLLVDEGAHGTAELVVLRPKQMRTRRGYVRQ